MSSEVLATKLSKIDRTKAPAKPTHRRTSGCWPPPCGQCASRACYLTGLLSPVNGRSRPPAALFPVAPVLKARRQRLLRRRDKLQETAVSQTTYEASYLLSTTRQGGISFFRPAAAYPSADRQAFLQRSPRHAPQPPRQQTAQRRAGSIESLLLNPTGLANFGSPRTKKFPDTPAPSPSSPSIATPPWYFASPFKLMTCDTHDQRGWQVAPAAPG